jgi:hypothetical protein
MKSSNLKDRRHSDLAGIVVRILVLTMSWLNNNNSLLRTLYSKEK